MCQAYPMFIVDADMVLLFECHVSEMVTLVMNKCEALRRADHLFTVAVSIEYCENSNRPGEVELIL